MSVTDKMRKKYGITSEDTSSSNTGLGRKTVYDDYYDRAVDDLYNRVDNSNLLNPFTSDAVDRIKSGYNFTPNIGPNPDYTVAPAADSRASRITTPAGRAGRESTAFSAFTPVGELEDSLIEQKKYGEKKKTEMPLPKWAATGTRDERDARVRQRYQDEQRIRELRDILAKEMPPSSVGVSDLSAMANTAAGKELLELENKIKQEDAKIDERRAAEKLHRYFALTKNDDFEANSKYDDTDHNFTLYNAVNGDSDARLAIGNEQAELAGGGDAGIGNLITGRYDEKATAQLLPSQKKIFNYLYKTQGAEAAQEYYDLIKSDLYQRVREADSEYWRQYAEDKPVEASIFSVLTKPASTLSYVGQAADMLSSGKLDRSSPTNRFVDNNNDIRQTVSKNFGKAGNFFYQTGMSMADFIYTGLISGSFFMGGGAGVASKVAEAITLGIMGTEAAADTVVQKMDAGYDDTRAFILGTIAGAAEIITEKVSLEALLNTEVLKHGAKGFAQYLLKNAASEGSEEGFSDLINWFADDLYDVITSQDESEWKRTLRKLKEQYPDASDSALLGKAIGQRAAELGLDVAGGALSGALMAGGSGAINLFNVSGLGKDIKSMGDDVVRQAVDVGLKNDKNSESYKIATELDAKLKDGKTLTDLEVGQLYQANYAEIEKAEADGKLRLPTVQQKFMNDLQNNIEQRILEAQNKTQEAQNTQQAALETQEAAQNAQTLESNAALNTQENAAQTRTEAESIAESKKLQLPSVKESNNVRENDIRNGSERYDSQNPGEQVRSMEEGAGRDTLRQTAAFAKDDGAVSVAHNGEAKSARELTGLDIFDDTDRSFYEATGNLSRDMQSAKKSLAALGLNLRIWLGGNMRRIDGASIEGVINGKDVWVRGDHPNFTASQLAGHEKGHYLIDSGAISAKDIREIVENLTSEKFVSDMINEYGQRWNKGRLPLTKAQRAEAIAGLYAGAYDGADMTVEEIWDEIVCDSVGGMNRFEGVRATAETKGEADTLLQYTGREAGKQASRAPPSESKTESKAESKSEGAKYSSEFGEDSDVDTAIQMLDSGFSPSEINNETGLIVLGNGNIIDIDGNIVGRYSRERSDEGRVREVREGAGRGEIYGREDRRNVARNTGREGKEKFKEWQALSAKAKDQVTSAVTAHMEKASAEGTKLVNAFSTTRQFAEQFYTRLLQGRLVAENWANMIPDIEGLMDELESIATGDSKSPVSQSISSAKTSIKQIPALFNNKNVEFGKTNIDIGGGRFDLATDYLKSIGTKNLVFDPYNRSEDVNSATLKYLQDGNKADTATCANVLNVIKEAAARENVILETAKAIKDDGKAYFMVYEGDGSGVGRETSAGWQNNRKTADYVDEIGEYFDSVERKGKLIIASDPKANLPKAAWETTPGKAVQFSREFTPTASDEKYLAAVNSNDMETAQKMVDEAAKAAGYDTPKLYHGTRAFGFTQFDAAKSDDGISFFATDSPRTAETYSGQTNRNRINERSSLNVDALHGEKLLTTAQEVLGRYKTYELATAEDRNERMKDERNSIEYSIQEAKEFINDHDGAFNEEKQEIANRIIDSMKALQVAVTEDELEDAYAAWQDAVWDLKDMDDSIAEELLDAIGRKTLLLSTAHLDDLMYSGDIYADTALDEYIFDNQLQIELDAELHKGIYELYGRPGKQLVIDAGGKNWDRITPPQELLLQGPQRTRNIAVAAKAAGYDSVLFKNLRDNGGETPYNGESNVYIFFNANDLKSADPVTYDDNGNVIPLSERFNTENEDIRYSREFDADLFDIEEDNRKRIAELQSELAKSRKGELYWKGQTKRTTTKTLRESDVNKLAKRLIKNYSSTLEAEDIAPKLKALGEYLLNNGDSKNELTYTEFSDRAADIARDIVDSALAEAEGNDTATLKDIRKYLRTNTLKLPAENKADMIDYAAFKKANPALKVSTQSGLDVDAAYMEMADMFGKAFFPDDIINPADQLQRIADVVKSLEPVYENPYSYAKADAIDYISADIVDSLLDESMRQTPPTAMDKAMQAAEEKRARQVQKAIEHGKQRVAEVRAQKNEQLQALKDYYTEMNQNARERRADSQARTKLLKIARRLNNKKLPLVMKNQLQQYIGELDLVAKSMTGKTLDKLTNLKKWYEEQKVKLGEDFIADEAIEDKLDRLSKKHINDLSAQEVADLTQILQFFEASIIEANKFKNSEVKQDRYAAGMRTVFDVQNARKGKINWQLRPSSAAMRIVGYDETSPIVTLMEEMIEGERQYDLYQREAVKPFEKWINNKKFMKSFSGKDARAITIKGTDVNDNEASIQITPAMAVEMLLASRNDDNMRHYQAGYAVFPDMKEYRKGNIDEAYNNTTKLSVKRSAILEAAKNLNAEELAYAAEIAKYYNDFAPKRLNETSLVIDGYEKFLEENYYPIVSDNKFLNQDYESLDENGNNAGLARPGFGEKRTHASNPAIVRDANLTLMQQIRMNGRYATMAIPLQNMSRLLNVKGRGMTTSVRETLAKQYSSSADAYLKKFMQDYAGKKAASERGLDPVLKKVRSKYAGGVLALSAGTAIKQFASYPTAAAITGAKPLLQAMNATLKADTSFIDELTAVYTKRKQGFSSVELGDLASINKSLPTALNWIQAVDVGTTKLLKRAAYFAVKNESPNLKVGSDAFKKAVVSKYIEIVEKTQPNYSAALRPEVLRSNSEIVRTISMFMTQPLQNYNLLYDAFGNYNAKRSAWKSTGTEEAKTAYKAAQKQLARTVTSQFVSALLFALMQYGWDRLRGKDDKYKVDGKWTPGAFTKGLGLNMLTSGAGMFVGGKAALELVEAATDGILKATGNDSIFDQSFYGLESAELGAITDAGKAALNLSTLIADTVKKSANGEDIDWEASARKLLTGAGSIGVMFGVPVDNVVKDVQALTRSVLHTMGKISGDPVKGDFLAKRIVDSNASAYYDTLYRYYNTDRDKFTELYDLMLKWNVADADKIKSGMEKLMKEEQDVDSVKDLDKRFLPPAEEETYDAIMTSAEKSPLWKGTRAKVQQQIKDLAYDAAQGKETKADAVDGVSYEEYINVMLNLDKYDEPNKSGNYYTYSQDEVTKAIDATSGLTRQQKYDLWQEITGAETDKNNPYRAQGSATKTVAKKTETKTEAKEEESTQTIDTTYSSMFSGASYDPSTNTLTLKFRGSGKTYTYAGVSADTWKAMQNADSLGSYYNSYIKGQYKAS